MPDSSVPINAPTTVGQSMASFEDAGLLEHEKIIVEYISGGQPQKVDDTTHPFPVIDAASVSLLTTIAALLAAQSFIQISATFAAIGASTAIRLVYVTADETNNGDISLYIYNGTALKFLQTVA